LKMTFKYFLTNPIHQTHKCMEILMENLKGNNKT
jgi:hypothetical protein